MEYRVEPLLTPPHPNTLESLNNQPLTGAFYHATADAPLGGAPIDRDLATLETCSEHRRASPSQILIFTKSSISGGVKSNSTTNRRSSQC